MLMRLTLRTLFDESNTTMSSPPPNEAPSQEDSEGTSIVVPKDPGFKKIHSTIASQLSHVFNGTPYPEGLIITFPYVSLKTGQQVINWYKRDIFNRQTNRLRLTFNPKYNVIQFKFSHAAGQALVKAFTTCLNGWTYNQFRSISNISKSINDGFRVLQCQPTHTAGPMEKIYTRNGSTSVTPTPVRQNVPLITPSLSLHSSHSKLVTGLPTIILEYSYSPTSSPDELSRHWHDLYRMRDLWFSQSNGRTRVVLLALFYPDDEGEENNSTSSRKKIYGRMDVWRYNKQWKRGWLTDEVVLFPVPPDASPDEEKINFSIREIYGEHCNFRHKESGIQEDMKFTLDIGTLRTRMKEYREEIWFANNRRRPVDLFPI
ncbi:hypothetical protein TWF281_009553 [Arthrobotrys megalospora]